MLKKENIKKYLFIAVMAYLAVNVIAQLYRLLAMIVASIASSYYSAGAVYAFSCIFSGLAYLSLLAITASVAVEQLRSLKPHAERFWFLPACFYGVVLLLTVISIFANTRYLSGFGAWVDWVFSSLFSFVGTVLYLAAFMLLYPRALLLLEEGPVMSLSALGKAGAGKPAPAARETAPQQSPAEAPDAGSFDWQASFGPQIDPDQLNGRLSPGDAPDNMTSGDYKPTDL